MTDPLSPKQLEFIVNGTHRWNLAHGSVRTGKTVCSVWAFMMQVELCPDSKIYMVGHTSSTIFRNVVRLLMESQELAIFRPYCTWHSSKQQLKYKDKTIQTIGAKDEGCIGLFQGDTYSLVYCDEMTLYPESIIDMINTRLSKPHSKGYAAMNPSHPRHKLKEWIDAAKKGDPNYYELHFTLDDNPYVDENYKQTIRDSLSGVFYKRNYLGLWCLAEGAIFDFFDTSIHVLRRAPTSAEYYLAGIDFGFTNAFACLVIGVNSGRSTQTGRRWWVENEYYWDSKVMQRQKVHSEYAIDVANFLEPYGVKTVYCDPSAAAFILELQRKGLHVVGAENDVDMGIMKMTSEMKMGNLTVLNHCPNLIREIEGYVWDSKAAEKGDDAPLKKHDHAVDALRYVIASHKVPAGISSAPSHDPYKYMNNRFGSRF